MKKYAYVLSYDDENQKWDLDIDLEEQRFKYGTVYNHDLRQWEQAYLGDEEYNGDEQLRTGQITKALEYLNNLSEGDSK